MANHAAAVVIDSDGRDNIDIDGYDPIISSNNITALTVLNSSQVAILTQISPPDMIQSIPGRGGKQFDYLAHNYVTKILNDAFGHKWDFEVSVVQIIQDVESIVKGRLTVYGNNGSQIVKEQFGQQDVLKNRDGQVVMSLGDCLKGAGSDALRKCASLLGIGLDLYGKQKPEKNREESLGKKFDKAKPAATAAKPAQTSKPVVSLRNIKYTLSTAKNLLELQSFWIKNTASIAALTEAERSALISYKDGLKQDLTDKIKREEADRQPPVYLITQDQIDRIKEIIKPGGTGKKLKELEKQKLADLGNNPNALKADVDQYIESTLLIMQQRESETEAD